MSNYFELLGIEPVYNIDLNKLLSQYFAMQSKYHPDNAKDDISKQQNIAISIEINKAYAVLKDDLARAEYLLEQNGLVLDDTAAKHRISTKQLSDIWHALEFVETTKTLTDLEYMLNNKIIEKEQLVKSLTSAFQDQANQEALDLTIKFKYLNNLISKIKLKIKSCK